MTDKLIILPKAEKGKKSKTISLRMDNSIIMKIDEISKRTNRSRNEIMNILIEYSIDKYAKD